MRLWKVATDEELMLRVKENDTAAFGELFDRYQQRLFLFLCRILRDVGTSEDVLQEVFLRVWEHRASYDSDKSFSTWVYTIAHNVAVDEFKKAYQKVVPFTSLEIDYRHIEDRILGEGDTYHDEIVEKVVLQIQVQKALQSLPSDQRVAVLLRECEGKSHREIGEVLGCTAENARQLVHRAKLTLAEIMEPLFTDGKWGENDEVRASA